MQSLQSFPLPPRRKYSSRRFEGTARIQLGIGMKPKHRNARRSGWFPRFQTSRQELRKGFVMTHKIWRVGLMFVAISPVLAWFGPKSPAAPRDMGITKREARQKNPLPATEKNIGAGKLLYQNQCMDCHGASGKGDGKSAADLDPKPSDLSLPEVAGLSDGALFWRITRGRKPMPGFERMMAEEDRWRVVLFIRTLQKSEGKKESSDPANQRPDF
jgi:mono/diheme cytochrome c family protein